jgi:hydroxyacylglutathione hydrolase
MVFSKRSIRKSILRNWLGLLVISLLFPACASKISQVGSVPTPNGSAPVFRFRMSFSNIHLIKSSPPVLIDAGSPGEEKELENYLKQVGLKFKDIGLVVLMHGHADHAGLAQFLQKQGIKVVLGEGDLSMAKAGRNDELKPTSLSAYFIKMFADFPMEPFVPDIVISGSQSMKHWGLDAEVHPLPGHTPGSIAIIFSDKQAFVGDLMAGGIMNGLFFSDSPGEHYFQPDIQATHQTVKKLLDEGIVKFYVGHGGPLLREAVSKSNLVN